MTALYVLAWRAGSVAAGAKSPSIPLYVVQLCGDPFELGLVGAVSAFVTAVVVIRCGAGVVLVLRRLSTRTRLPHEPPPHAREAPSTTDD